jgi:hypothetical protein
MTSPVKRRILANLKPGDEILVTYHPEHGNGISGILKTDKRGQLVLHPHPRVVRDSNGDSPSLVMAIEIVEAAS